MFVWETNLFNELLVVEARHSRLDREDQWSWTLSSDGRYSIKSANYHLLKGLPVTGAPDGEVMRAVSRWCTFKSCCLLQVAYP